jgi:F-type H+-transporting ATPase subunit epsilon
MPKQISLEIVTPEGVCVREAVEEVEAPGVEGYFGVLPGHTPFLSELKIGTVRYRVGGEDHLVAVTWGFAEVLPYKVTLLVNTAERGEDIDLQRAETARQRAQQRLEEFGVAYETDRARESAEKAQARLETAERAKKGKQ